MRKFKKILVSLCIVILLFNIVSPAMAAKQEYDHETLMEYDGYGKAMYETIVEESMFVTGQYTKNKEYVNKSIDQIRDYASFWWNEQKLDSEPFTYDRFKEVIAKPAGYLLTVGDWFKNKFFGGYKERYGNKDVADGFYSQFVEVKYDVDSQYSEKYSYRVKPGYYLEARLQSGSKSVLKYTTGFQYMRLGGSWAGFESSAGYEACLADKRSKHATAKIYFTSFLGSKYFEGNLTCDMHYWSSNGIFDNTVAMFSYFDITIFVFKDDNVEIQPEYKDDILDSFEKDLKKQVVIPQPRPYLSCPNGTKIQMSIDGGTFLGVDGKALIVNKDGTAEIDSAICKLGWDKPQIKYIDNRAAIETPEGKWQDAETGKMLDGDGDGDGDGEDGECGMLCSLGKLTKFILDFFEKLLEFFIKIFVPEDMDFVTNEFDKLKNNFDEKLGVVGDLKGTMESFFAQENSNPLADLTISLPATGGQPLKIIETSLIEKHVPTVKKVMSGILVLTTVFYLYRKITGRGGVMEK